MIHASGQVQGKEWACGEQSIRQATRLGLSSACRTGQSRRVKTSSRRKVLYKSKQFWRACGNPCDQTFSLNLDFAGPCHGCSYQVRDVFDVSLDSASLGVVVQEGRHFTLACPWVLNAQ